MDQWTAFPAGAHDDMVDSTTQALSFLLFTNGAAQAEPEEVREVRNAKTRAERAFLDPTQCYDIYGDRNRYG